MKNVTVLASGNGSNFQALLDNSIPVTHLVSDNPQAYALDRANENGVYWSLCQMQDSDRQSWGYSLQQIIGEPDLIVCAGFMRILPVNFVERYKGRVINIHPSLLPAYKGSIHAIQDAYEAGDSLYGATVHWVTEEVDDGEIISQESIELDPTHPLSFIEESVHNLEHKMLPSTVKQLLAI